MEEVSTMCVSLNRDKKLLQLHIDQDEMNTSPKKYRTDQVYSPVTDLTLNLGAVLSTISHVKEDTPKRKLCNAGILRRPNSLLVVAKPPSLSKQISDEGYFAESPSPVESDESPSFQKRLDDLLSKSEKPRFSSTTTPKDVPPSAAFRRFQSMPVPFCGFDPTPPSVQHGSRLSDGLLHESPIKIGTPKTGNLFSPDCSKTPSFSLDFSIGSNSPPSTHKYSSSVIDEDENSQDSGVCMDKGDSKDSVEFKCPLAPPPRRARTSSESANSPYKYSPALKADTPLSFSKNLFQDSPIKLKSSSLTNSQSDDEGDDGFLELLDVEDKENSVPKGMEKLFNAPVITKQQDDLDCSMSTPSFFKSRTLADVTNQENSRSGSFRRGLFRSPSAPKLSKSQTFCVQRVNKRSEPCSEEDSTPRVTKRRKSVLDQENKENNASNKSVNRPKLQRCQSDTEAIVKAALARLDNHKQADKQLIGDMSKEYILPTVRGKHQDLKSITPETLADLLNGEYKHVVEKFVIIDCRYPYEYEGGHISAAKNMYTKDSLYDEFLKNPNKMPSVTEDGKRNILIFHCEFSSERAPKLSRFLRSQDRDLNKESYPNLSYPEIYLLDQGYKNFFHSEQQLCVPQTYMTMLDERYGEDLRKFRIKTKSWSGDRKAGKGRLSVRSGLKF